MPERIIINDSNYQQFINPVVDGEVKKCSFRGMFRPQSIVRARTFEDLKSVPLIPEADWDDHIDQLERDKATLKDFCLESGLEVLNQGQTNYCWINSPTFCAMIARLQETGQCIRFSPASAGARIKNFRNVGGWGSEGLEFMIENGINEQDDWPANAIERRYDTPENREKAKKNRVLEYFHLKSYEEVVSCILSGVPVACGFNWWSHEVTGMYVTLRTHNLGIGNSWSPKWGEYGYGELEGRKRIPDDAVAMPVLMAA